MTTSTLDRIDFSTILDDEPACEADECDQAATHRLRLQCGCALVKCSPHTDLTVAYIGDLLRDFRGIRCAWCKTNIDGNCVSDIVTVTAL